jgi:hypothetical protein
MAFFDDNYEIPGGPVAMDTINSQLPPAPRVPAPAPAPPPVQFPEMPPSQPPPMLARPEEPPPSAPPLPVVRPPGAGGVGPSAPRSGPSFDAQQTALNKSAMKGAEFEAKQQGLKSDAQMFQANEHAKALGQSQNEQKALEAAYVPERKRLDAIQAAEKRSTARWSRGTSGRPRAPAIRSWPPWRSHLAGWATPSRRRRAASRTMPTARSASSTRRSSRTRSSSATCAKSRKTLRTAPAPI